MTSTAPRWLSFGREPLDLPPEPFRLDPVIPRSPPAEDTSGDPVHEAFDRPLGCPPLEEIFRGARKVLVVVSDATRSTAAAGFIPTLLSRIHSSCRAEVTFIIASGIHRRPTDGEVRSILGDEPADRHRTILHDPDNGAELCEVGRTRSGTTVRVNAALAEHDRVVITGAAGFHYYAGFSGGRKALVPGLAARETVTRNHLRALRPDGSRHPAASAGRLHGNPVHRDMAEGAGLVDPDLLVNSVVGENGRVERLFVGHWRRAHEAACRYVRSRRVVRLSPRNLVVASAGGDPYDVNLIQAHKAYEAGVRALTPHGVFILVAACPEGAGHADFLPWFRFESESAWVRALRADFRVYGQTGLSWFRKARTYKTILVSRLEADLVARLGVRPAADLEEAFRLAREELPAGTPGWVIPQGGRILPEATGVSA
jgi:nickel-dependent lactate racemase